MMWNFLTVQQAEQKRNMIDTKVIPPLDNGIERIQTILSGDGIHENTKKVFNDLDIRLRAARPEEAFHFLKAISVVLPTPYQAKNLREFAQGLEAVTIDSLYFHIFEARIRLERRHNDFSMWFLDSLGETDLAQAVSSLDPYSLTMEEVRQRILKLVHRRLGELQEMTSGVHHAG